MHLEENSFHSGEGSYTAAKFRGAIDVKCEISLRGREGNSPTYARERLSHCAESSPRRKKTHREEGEKENKEKKLSRRNNGGTPLPPHILTDSLPKMGAERESVRPRERGIKTEGREDIKEEEWMQ